MVAKVLTQIDTNKMLRNLTNPPTIVNNLSLETEKDQLYLRSLAVNTYTTTDVVSVLPICRCGAKTGGHRKGTTCGECGTTVESPLTSKIESDLWIAAPEEIGHLISPLAWIMLSRPLMSGKFSGLAWICNPNIAELDRLRIPLKAVRLFKVFKKLNIPRGLKSFIENFDLVLEKIILPAIQGMGRRAELREYTRRFRSRIFVKYIPIPSKVAMVVEETSVGNYYDKTIDNAMEAIHTAADTSGEHNQAKLEGRFTTVLTSLGIFYQDVVKNVLSEKSGFLRRVCYGSRMNLAFRNIITSYHEPHDYGTCKIPYHQFLTCHIPETLSVLIRKHEFNYRDAYDYIQMHQKDNDPFLWAILEELIDNTPHVAYKNPVNVTSICPLTTRSKAKGRGFGVVGVRYPSLDRGSAQALRVVGLTTDSIQISVLVLRAYNADFDGDNMSFALTPDQNSMETDGLAYLEPHYNIHSTSKPFKLRHITDLPDATVANISNRIASEILVI